MDRDNYFILSLYTKNSNKQNNKQTIPVFNIFHLLRYCFSGIHFISNALLLKSNARFNPMGGLVNNNMKLRLYCVKQIRQV